MVNFIKIQKKALKAKSIFTYSSEYLKYALIFSELQFFRTPNDIDIQQENLELPENLQFKLAMKEYGKNDFFIDIN